MVETGITDEYRDVAERLSLAVEAAAIGVWELRADGSLIWNRAMRQIYGLADDVTPTFDLWRSMVGEAERVDAEAALVGLAERGGRDERRFTAKCLDGVERHIVAVIKLQKGRDGAPDRIIGTNIDITDRKREEHALAAMSTRMETLVAAARIGILVQRDFKPLMSNNALAEILGLPDRFAVEALPSFEAFFDFEQRFGLVRVWSALMAGDPALDMVMLRGKRSNGQPLEVEVRSFCIDWAGGPAICAMVTDVTAQRAIEAQLHQAQRLEAVGQLTGGVAHDFNNLLTVILGNAELLEEELVDNPFQYRLAGMIVRAAERGADLARHLLSFSRRQELEPGTVDIAALLAGLADFLRRAVGATIDLEMRMQPDLWSAVVDMAQLENALLNLAVNARDAMPAGGKLAIAARNIAAEDSEFDRPADLGAGAYVMISVNDAGSGMDEATRLRVFEPFFTTKEVGKGTGLGLSMVYGFVKQSNGAVQLHSALGKGTTVELWLPRSEKAKRPLTAIDTGQMMPGGDEHILVVEDDPMVRVQVVAQLEMLGYRLTSAENGVAALALLREDLAIDLLFTDIVMPGGMSGHDLAAQARALRPNLSILLTSGFADRSKVPENIDLLGLPMLQKPYHREAMARKVRETIDAGTILEHRN